MSRARDPYPDVGAATRFAIEQALSTREGNELGQYARTLLAVIHSTSTWSRLSDAVYRAQLAELADLSEKRVAAQLRVLDERGVAIWRPSSGRSNRSLVGLPGALPVQLPLMSVVDKPVDSRRKGDRNGAEKGTRFGPKRAELGTPTEKDPRRTETPAPRPNVDNLPCEVCARIELYGFRYATLWFCERHRQDSFDFGEESLRA